MKKIGNARGRKIFFEIPLFLMLLISVLFFVGTTHAKYSKSFTEKVDVNFELTQDTFDFFTKEDSSEDN